MLQNQRNSENIQYARKAVVEIIAKLIEKHYINEIKEVENNEKT